MKAMKMLILVLVSSYLVACSESDSTSGFDMNAWGGIGIATQQDESGRLAQWETLLDCRVKTSKNLYVYYQAFRSPDSEDKVINQATGQATEYGQALISISATWQNPIEGQGGFKQLVYQDAKIYEIQTDDSRAIVVRRDESLLASLEAINEAVFNIPDYSNGEDSNPLNFSYRTGEQDDVLMMFVEDAEGVHKNLSMSLLPGFEPITSIMITEKGDNFSHKLKMECR